MSTLDLSAPPAPIAVIVVDDHPLLRAGLLETIGSQPDMRVLGEAADGAQAVDLFKRCNPSITIMDIAMPGMDGLDALEAIRAIDPSARVIMLTTYKYHAQIRRAVKAGAAGLMLKGSMPKDLLDVIRAVHSGERWIAPEIAQELAAHIDEKPLSDRELSVLRSAGQGNTNKRIAQQLNIAEETVKAHMRNILEKLGAQDRTHAVTIALQRGILGQ